MAYEQSEVERKAIAAVYRGQLVECSKDEYPLVRSALQDQAGRWIDGGDPMRAQIALREVARLDTKFDFTL